MPESRTTDVPSRNVLNCNHLVTCGELDARKRLLSNSFAPLHRLRNYAMPGWHSPLAVTRTAGGRPVHRARLNLDPWTVAGCTASRTVKVPSGQGESGWSRAGGSPSVADGGGGGDLEVENRELRKRAQRPEQERPEPKQRAAPRAADAGGADRHDDGESSRWHGPTTRAAATPALVREEAKAGRLWSNTARGPLDRRRPCGRRRRGSGSLCCTYVARRISRVTVNPV